MEFSDTYKHSGHCVFSPDARFLAVAVDYRLVIRDVVSLKVSQEESIKASTPTEQLLQIFTWKVFTIFFLQSVSILRSSKPF